MHVLQRTKAPMPFLRNARVTRLLFVFACLLLCSTIVSLFTGVGMAHAATLTTRSANAASSTHGGGCATDSTLLVLEACISENSKHLIVPDTYLLTSGMCNVTIFLYKDGSEVNHINYSICYSVAPWHLIGISVGASTGHEYTTVVEGYVLGVQLFAYSPPLYT